MADFLTFDPDDDECFKDVFERTLKPMAIHWCDRDVEAAKDLVQETIVRLYKKKPWEQEKLSTYEALVPYAVAVMKNIRKKSFRKQQRRDALRPKVAQRFGESVDDLTRTEDRIDRESFAQAVAPLFSGNEEMLRYIQYEFIDNLTHAEIAEELGLTPRQLTKRKRRFGDAIPRDLAFRLVGRKRRKE